MADGDYERGRGREIAAIAARLKRLASARAKRSDVNGQECPFPEERSDVNGLCPGERTLLSVHSLGTPGILVLNGWAASEHAWDLCSFRKSPGVQLFSYIDQLNGLPEQTLLPSCPPALLPKCTLVGWSMGGSSALRLACRFPERVAGLVLIAATPRMMEEKETGWRGMNARRLDALRRGLELTHGEGFFGVPEGKPNPYQVDVPENLERGLKYLLDTDVRADLERVFGPNPSTLQPFNLSTPFPVFIFQSEHDGIVRPENAVYLKTVFPQARVQMVPGTEHALPIWIPQEIDHAVDACLAVAAQG